MKFINRFTWPQTVDRTLVRNYVLFLLALSVCAGTLITILISGDRAIAQIGKQVEHTYEVITRARQLSTTVEGMLAAQRGFIITTDEKFLDNYHARRDRVSALVAGLTELAADNPSQASRVDELRHHFNDFSVKLEQRARTVTITAGRKIIMEDVEEVDGLKDNILRINGDILREEYGLLNARIRDIETQKSRYFSTLIIGILVTAILLSLFNWFLLTAQRKRHRIAASLKNTEERFALAVEGTQDGIFDWDIQTGKVFYSKRFFGMLGYDRGGFMGTDIDFKEAIHPEDEARVQEYIRSYLKKEIPEYSQEYRMRCNDGRWLWVQSRAKAIFDEKGNAERLVGAHTDITLTKENEARLESEKKAAEDANRAKSDFLAHMSHEIRTPLTAISGIAEIFEKKQDNLDEKQKKLVRTLHSSTGVLKDTINDILDFSKIESGELELEETSFPIGTLFEDVTSMMSVRANEKGISFIFDYTDVRDLNFCGDKLRLRQIIVNLIGNAIKFTKEGGVMVKASRQNRDDQEFLKVDITDTGIGIAPDDFEPIFERFKQADASVSRKFGGTGLGLPISKNLATLMGGSIILNSEVGKGSTFSVAVPMKTAKGEIAAPKKAPPKRKLVDQKRAIAPQDERKVLMVEDYEGNIVVIGHILDELNYAYDVAKTGLQALDLWEKNHYALILMDIQMPEMDGFAATIAIRETEKSKKLLRTPIIGMTAHALVDDKEKCIAAGMDAYLPKPIVETDLKQKILHHINARKKAA